MKSRQRLAAAAASLLVAGTAAAEPVPPTPPQTLHVPPGHARHHPAPVPPDHVVTHHQDLDWGPAPPGLPPGAQAALVEGDPHASGTSYTLRLAVPPGYAVAPHFHPRAEHITVLAGVFQAGNGDVLDPRRTEALGAGDFVSMPAGHHHFFVAGPQGAVVQVHGLGPFEITYVDPADDPRGFPSAGWPWRPPRSRWPDWPDWRS